MVQQKFIVILIKEAMLFNKKKLKVGEKTYRMYNDEASACGTHSISAKT